MLHTRRHIRYHPSRSRLDAVVAFGPFPVLTPLWCAVAGHSFGPFTPRPSPRLATERQCPPCSSFTVPPATSSAATWPPAVRRLPDPGSTLPPPRRPSAAPRSPA